MTLLYSVSDGDVIQAADVNQYKSMLEGASGYTSTYLLASTGGTNFIIRLGDAAGVNKLSIQDSAGVEQFSMNSDGALTGTSITFSTLYLPVSASPSQTAEGQIVWDTDDDVLTMGTGTATKRLGLTRGAGSDASATAELVYDTTAAELKVWDGSASLSVSEPFTTIIKSATETISNSTVLQNDNDFLFTAAADTDYLVEMVLRIAGFTTSDWKLAWTLTGMTWDGAYSDTIRNSTSTINTALEATASGAGQSLVITGNAIASIWKATFVIHSGGTGGTVNFQWAQDTAVAENTSVLKNSYMTYRKLGAT